MALMGSSTLLKGSVKLVILGLGVYIGLRVVVPLLAGVAKSLGRQAERECGAQRSLAKRAGKEEPGEEAAEEEIEIIDCSQPPDTLE